MDNFATTPATVFTDGDYCITVFDVPEIQYGKAGVLAELYFTMFKGDSGTPSIADVVAEVLAALAGKPLTVVLPS